MGEVRRLPCLHDCTGAGTNSVCWQMQKRTPQRQRNIALCNDVSLHSQNDGSELTDSVGSGRQPRRRLGGPEPVPISARRCRQNDHQVRGRGRRDLDPPPRRPGDL